MRLYDWGKDNLYIVHCDGSYREDFKRMAIGVYIFNCGTGKTTKKYDLLTAVDDRGMIANGNTAEIYAVITALDELMKMGCTREEIRINTDSKLVTGMYNYTVTPSNKKYKKIFKKLRKRLKQFSNIRIKWVPRGKNKVADALCYEAYNEFLNSDTEESRFLRKKYGDAKKRSRKRYKKNVKERQIQDMPVIPLGGYRFLVLSSKKDRLYTVDLYSRTCNCKAFFYKKREDIVKCKHIAAAERFIQPRLPVGKKHRTYQRNRSRLQIAAVGSP